jgi:ribosomal protein S18 acetylase RimI-like enzyme
MELKIEKGTEKDLDEIAQFYDDINDFLEKGENYPGWRKGIYPVREDAVHGLEQDCLFIVRAKDKIAGSVILSHEPEQGYEKATWGYKGGYDRIYVIHTLAVHPDYLKMGIGRRLLQFAEEFGLENGIEAIRLDVNEKNIPAINLYESCGYQYIARVDLGYGAYGIPWFKLYEKLLKDRQRM